MSKKLIILISILICGNLSAQIRFVNATSQGWAGGVCCRQGTNYVITLSGTKKEMESIKIEDVCIGGKLFDSPQSVISYGQTEDVALMNIRCYYSTNNEDNIDIAKLNFIPCTGLCVTYSIKNKEYTVKITKVEELEYIAYP